VNVPNTSEIAEDEVDKAILDALQARADLGGFSEEEDEALVTAAVDQYLAVRSEKTSGRVIPWLVAGGLLAAAAAVAIWSVSATTGGARQQSTQGAPQAMWEAEGQGAVLQGTAVASSAEICGTRDGARACLTRGSRGAFAVDGDLELQEGTVQVQTQVPLALSVVDHAVAVSTAADFSATRQAEDWTVSVDAGSVTLSGPDTSRVLGAGETASSGQPKASAVEAAQDSEPAAVDPGSSTSGPARAAKGAEPVQSADELLQLARSQRAAKRFDTAARTYERLLREHPKSKKVPATLVSLAQLYQGPLDNPAKALRHFDRYLQRGGPLAEEAHYGKIRALRSLGRAAVAQTEVEAFLQAYPSSAYADALARD
jgi:tetratricopeptide (TPR) repeat protein